MNIGVVVSRNAKRYPNKIGIVDASVNKRITWREFNERVNCLSNALLDLGLKKGDRLTIYSRNCLEYFEFYYACAKTGVIGQPLNWRFIPDEIAYTINNAEPKAVIVQDQFVDVIKAIRPKLSSIRYFIGLGKGHDLEYDYDTLTKEHSPEEPRPSEEIHDDDIYFLCYTGGTTGISKGVMQTHKNVFTNTVNMTVAEGIKETDVYLILGALFHTAVNLSQAYIFHGCTNVLLDFEPQKTLAVIQKERVTSFLAIATMLNYLLDVPNFREYDLSSVKRIGYGGGPMSPETLKRAMEAFKADFIQYMGQTEATIVTTWLSPEDHKAGLKNEKLLLSCGKEAICTEVRIVDDQDDDVPKDGKTVGEMVYRGDNVMKGYWKMPELTAETLRNGWLHSGDMATWDEDGYMYVVDRKKDMIVSGGENIYSTAVEGAVYKHPAVKECAVIAVPHPTWGETPKAIVVLKEGMTATQEEIIEVCRKNLASYMKPTSVDFVDELPKMPTGKVLKRVLKEKYWAGKEKRVGGV